MQSFHVRVPASTANLGPGFDTLGIALQLYLTVDIQIAEKTVIHYTREEEEHLADLKNNLILRMVHKMFQEAGKPIPHVHMVIDNQIPLARGLGSSAAAIIAGLCAGNALLGSPFSNAELHTFATEEEGHPDNVGASLYGGFVISTWDGKHVHSFQTEPADALHVVALIPEVELATSKARNVLPGAYTQQDVSFNIAHSSMLVASILSGRLDLLHVALQDRIHQPYRFELIPQSRLVIDEMKKAGAYGVVISGAGPALLTLCNESNVSHIMSRLESITHRSSVVKHLPIDKQGAQVRVVHP